jgi:hypothetical protein
MLPIGNGTCPVRKFLSKAVMDAINKSYLVRQDYELAQREINSDSLAATLQVLAEAERAALRALEQHIKQHGCKT